MKIDRQRAIVQCLLFACLALLFLSLGYQAVGGFWRADDPAILAHLLEHSLLDIFIRPETWRALSPSNLTPWLSLSFYIDLQAFGLRPTFFYLHQLASLFALLVVLFLLLSRWMPRLWAFFGVLLFLTGTPVWIVAAQLMTRHYIEGLLFVTLSLLFLHRYMERPAPLHLALAVGCYALAVTAKEIYVPLVLLVPFLPSGKTRDRVLTTLPFIAIAGLYTVWRAWMLSDTLGGYADSGQYFDPAFWWQVLLDLGRIPGLLMGDLGPLFFLIYLAVILAWLAMDRHSILPYGAALLLVLLPLAPLTVFPGLNSPGRYLLLPWYFLCVTFCLALWRLYQHWRRGFPPARAAVWVVPALGAFMLALPAIQTGARLPDARAQQARSDVQMRFLWEHGADKAVLADNTLNAGFWKITGLQRIKKLTRPNASSPRVIIDDRFLSEAGRLFRYSADCNCMQDITEEIPARLARLHETWRRDAPLEVHMRNDQGWISWRFGPYREGEYRVLTDQFGSYRMPSSVNSLRTGIDGDVHLYVLYLSPEGWRTYSEQITLPADGTPLEWRRE